MNQFYRIGYQSSGEIGRTYPQSQSFDSKIPVDSPNHLWMVDGKLDSIVYIPDSILHKKAKLTDLVSSSPIMYPIISDKLKDILQPKREEKIQFLPTYVITNSEKIPYWLMNAYAYDYDLIDFKKTIINQYDVSGKIIKTLKVKNAEELQTLLSVIKNTKDYLQIDNLTLVDNISEDFFFINHTGFGSKYFLSEKLMKEIILAEITGITFTKYNEKYP
jgi:hypothetical protein